MAYPSYALEDQYIFPEEARILTPSPAPAPNLEQPDHFQRMPEFIPPILGDYLAGMLNPMLEKFEQDKRRIRYIKSLGYYLAYVFMMIIGFIYIYAFTQLFAPGSKK